MRLSPQRYSLLAAALVAAIASAGVLTGCDGADLGAASQTVAADADGEALLRGLLFGQGEAADALPEVWATPDAEQALASLTPEMRGEQDALITALYRADPTFFERFERDVTSGDLQRVDAGLRSATEFVQAFAPEAESQKVRQVDDVIIWVHTVCGYWLVCPPPTIWPVLILSPKAGNDLFLGEGEGAELRREELVGRLAGRLARTR